MNSVFVVGGVEREVELDLSDTQATVGDLIASLESGAPQGAGLVVEGRFIAPDVVLAEVGLRQGALLHVGPPQPPEPARPVVAELRVAGGLLGGRRWLLPPGPYVVGRDSDADIVLDQETVSPRHARVTIDADGSSTIEDLGSLNGTKVEGVAVTAPTRLADDQLVEIGAVQLTAVRNLVTDAPLRESLKRDGRVTFNRPPRGAPPPEPDGVIVPAAPDETMYHPPFGWAAMLLPVLMGGVLWAVTQNPLYAAFMLLSPAMLIGNWIEEKRRTKKMKTERTEELHEKLREFHVALARQRDAELNRRRYFLPDPAEIVRRAVGPSTLLWERRLDNDDFMQLSAGTGTLPWHRPLLESNPEQRAPEADAALKAEVGLARAPIDFDLRAGNALGVVGERAAALATIRSIVCQAAVHHGPADLRIAILTEPLKAHDWDWAKWLPHTSGFEEGSSARLLAATESEISAVLTQLLEAPQLPESQPAFVAQESSAQGPLTLVVVDAEGLTEGRDAPARDLLAGAGRPVSGIVLSPSTGQLPSQCSSIVELFGRDGGARFTKPGEGLSVTDCLVAGMPEEVARECARALAGLEDPEVREETADLPELVSVLRMLGVRIPSSDAIAARWRSAGRVPQPAAPIGVTERGPLMLDLVTDGPHGLIAGTTGSGKSELLRTLVVALASTLDPEQLNFVLVDYKGGAAFDACARLPHTVGLVTDLDEHLAERALVCLEAELRYRERRLRDAGATDLGEYLKAGLPEPLPRLVVVIDEFATLASELPDFVDSLVDIAQRGRSLGVHLVLATQRPAGAVSDHIRANTNLRIALRVQDSGDSIDVIGAPLAAAIGRRRPGRGYARLGPGEIVPFQAALASGATHSVERAAVGVKPFAFGAGMAAPAAHAVIDESGEHPSDLALLVDSSLEAAVSEGVREPRLPWPPPLPDSISLEDLKAEDTDAGGELWWAPIGLVDEPSKQMQRPFPWDGGNLLLYGVTGSGTTTALTTLGVSLASKYSPSDLHLYGMDFGTGGLAPLDDLPHTGAVVAAAERERHERLVRQLRTELERRRTYMARMGVTQVAELGSRGTEPPPAIVLLLDNYGGFASAYDDISGIGTRDQLTRVIADGPGVGIYVVLTADRPNAVPASVATLIPQKLIFRLADPYDYANFGLSPRKVPKLGPGRCVEPGSEREVHIALPHRDGLVAAVASIREPEGEEWLRPRPVGLLPEEVKREQVMEAAHVLDGSWHLPLGIGDSDLAPVGLTLGAGDHALIAGSARSGKSTTLALVAGIVAETRPDISITAIALRPSPLREARDLRLLVTEQEDLPDAVAGVESDDAPHLLLIDDADVLEDAGGDIERLLAARHPKLHVIAAGRADTLRGLFGHWSKEIRSSRLGLVLRPNVETDGELWQIMLPRRGPSDWPAGRGYLVMEGRLELVQVALP